MENSTQDYNNLGRITNEKTALPQMKLYPVFRKPYAEPWENRLASMLMNCMYLALFFLEKLWRRLLTISVEDIGFGNLNAAV